MKRILIALLLAASVGTALSGCVAIAAAGAGGAVLVGTDRRSSGIQLDDQTAESRIGSQISDRFKFSHVNVASYNRAVLLTGELPDEAARNEVELLARGIPNVRKVYNQTVVAEASSLGNRLNDSSLTSKVKGRMVTANQFAPNHVKVISERGEVYLLGLVTPAEAEAATRIASETSGVLKVNTFFEYLDPRTGQAMPEPQQPQQSQ